MQSSCCGPGGKAQVQYSQQRQAHGHGDAGPLWKRSEQIDEVVANDHESQNGPLIRSGILVKASMPILLQPPGSKESSMP